MTAIPTTTLVSAEISTSSLTKSGLALEMTAPTKRLAVRFPSFFSLVHFFVLVPCFIFSTLALVPRHQPTDPSNHVVALIRLSVEACAAVGEAVTPSSVPTPSDFTDLPTITSDASVTPSATETQTETETETDTDAATSATSATSVTSVTSVASATGTDGPEPSASDGADSDDGDNDGDSAASRVQAAGWAVAGAVAAVLAI